MTGDIHVLDLPAIALSERWKLPDCAAVYFVLDSTDAVLYIGQSISLARRWASHHRLSQLQVLGAGRIAWLAISDHSLLIDVERACIEHFQPALNGTEMPDFQRADDRITVSFPASLGREIRAAADELAIPVSILVKQWAVERLRQWQREARHE